jgi:hypothetical protein
MRFNVRLGGLFLALLACLFLAAPHRAHAQVQNNLRSIRVSVASAAVLTLNATPVTIVAAPGANRCLIFEGATVYKSAGTAYGGIAAGEDFAVKYTDASGLQVGSCETTGFMDQATAQVRFVRAYSAASGVSDITPVANAPLVLHLLTGEIATGTSPVVLRVLYRIVSATP